MLHRQFGKQLPRRSNTSRGDASKARNMDTVAAIRSSLDNAMKKHHLIFPFPYRHVQIPHALDPLGESVNSW